MFTDDRDMRRGNGNGPQRGSWVFYLFLKCYHSDGSSRRATLGCGTLRDYVFEGGVAKCAHELVPHFFSGEPFDPEHDSRKGCRASNSPESRVSDSVGRMTRQLLKGAYGTACVIV